jgi:histone H3/H4
MSSRKNNEILSDSCIKKMSAVAGIGRIGSCAYKEIREVIHECLSKIIGYSIVMMEHANRKTLLLIDTDQSIDLLNYRKKRDVLFFQKNTLNDSLIPLNSFSKIVKRIAKEKTKIKTAPRIADEAMQNLRNFIEKKIINLLKNSKRNAAHSKRATVKADDIKLAYSYDSN